jgi:hypothetical protein
VANAKTIKSVLKSYNNISVRHDANKENSSFMSNMPEGESFVSNNKKSFFDEKGPTPDVFKVSDIVNKVTNR